MHDVESLYNKTLRAVGDADLMADQAGRRMGVGTWDWTRGGEAVCVCSEGSRLCVRQWRRSVSS